MYGCCVGFGMIGGFFVVLIGLMGVGKMWIGKWVVCILGIGF